MPHISIKLPDISSFCSTLNVRLHPAFYDRANESLTHLHAEHAYYNIYKICSVSLHNMHAILAFKTNMHAPLMCCCVCRLANRPPHHTDSLRMRRTIKMLSNDVAYGSNVHLAANKTGTHIFEFIPFALLFAVTDTNPLTRCQASGIRKSRCFLWVLVCSIYEIVFIFNTILSAAHGQILTFERASFECEKSRICFVQGSPLMPVKKKEIPKTIVSPGLSLSRCLFDNANHIAFRMSSGHDIQIIWTPNQRITWYESELALPLETPTRQQCARINGPNGPKTSPRSCTNSHYDL